MGNLSVVVLVLSILTLFYDAIPKLHELKKPLAILTAVSSIYLLGLDMFVFLKNPYPISVKLIDLVLRNLLGGIYKKYKTIWSLQKWWPSFYCNPFTFGETYFKRSRYMVLVRKNGLDLRAFDDVRRFEDNDHRFSVSVRNMEGRWGDELEWMELVEEGAFLQKESVVQQRSKVKSISDIYTKGVKTGYDVSRCCKLVRHYNILGKMVAVRANIHWGIECTYQTEITELSKTRILYRIQGKCADYNCLFRIFCAWSWFETEPECGVIDLGVGGLKNGVRYIHTVNLDTMHRSIECGDYVLKFVHHEYHGFCVA